MYIFSHHIFFLNKFLTFFFVARWKANGHIDIYASLTNICKIGMYDNPNLCFNSCMSIFHQYTTITSYTYITFDGTLEFSSMSLSFLLCSHKQWTRTKKKKTIFYTLIRSDPILWISIYIFICFFLPHGKFHFRCKRRPTEFEEWSNQRLVHTNFCPFPYHSLSFTYSYLSTAWTI